MLGAGGTQDRIEVPRTFEAMLRVLAFKPEYEKLAKSLEKQIKEFNDKYGKALKLADIEAREKSAKEAERKAVDSLHEAKATAEEMLREARSEAQRIRQQANDSVAQLKRDRAEFDSWERRTRQELDAQRQFLAKREQGITNKERDLDQARQQAERAQKAFEEKLGKLRELAG